jgi:hypothetical protein
MRSDRLSGVSIGGGTLSTFDRLLRSTQENLQRVAVGLDICEQ